MILDRLRTALAVFAGPPMIPFRAEAGRPGGRAGRSYGLRLVDTGMTRTVRHGRRHRHRLTGRWVEPKPVTIRIFTHRPR